tara:strand:+ start:1795 stop:2796 length:1002 start_codon:yes stop_codon:yes gene_type:complete
MAMGFSDRPFGFEDEVFAPPEVVRRRGTNLYVKTAEWLTEVHAARFGTPLRVQGEGHCDFDPRRGIEQHYWSIRPDASVSGRKPGVEVISPKMAGRDDLAEVHRVVTLLNEARFTVDSDAGLHVHHAATPDHGFDVDAWKRLKANYYLLEPAFDRFMKPGRNYGNMSAATVRSIAVDGHREVMARIAAAKTMQDIMDVYDDIGMELHHKLTADKFPAIGTAEWRHHHATVDPDAAVNWIRLTQRIMDHSATSKVLLTPDAPTTDFIAAAEQVEFTPKRTRDALMDRLLQTDRGADGMSSNLERYYRKVLLEKEGPTPVVATTSAPTATVPRPR